MRDWSDEPWVKLYQRDEADWLAMPLEAQSVLALTLRKFDRAGFLRLGRQGIAALPSVLGHPHRSDFILEGARYLIETDGCWRLQDEGRTLFWPNYLDAQTAQASDRARQKLKRERDRDVATSKGISPQASAFEASETRKAVTQDASRRTVTPAVTQSVTTDVTPAVTQDASRLEETRLEEKRSDPFGAAPIDDLDLFPDEAPPKSKPAKKPRKDSDQVVLLKWLTERRMEVLGPNTLPDEPMDQAEANTKLKPLIALDEDLLGDAFDLFLADDYALGLDPPCPIRLFVKKWSGYVSKAQRKGAA